MGTMFYSSPVRIARALLKSSADKVKQSAYPKDPLTPVHTSVLSSVFAVMLHCATITLFSLFTSMQHSYRVFFKRCRHFIDAVAVLFFCPIDFNGNARKRKSNTYTHVFSAFLAEFCV